MKPHDTFLELAAVAIDYDLTPTERARLEGHLAGCATCVGDAKALRADAQALAGLPPVTLPERRGAEILAAALHPGAVRSPLRIVALVALLGLLLVGSLVAGSEILRRGDRDLAVVVVPAPSPTPRPAAIPAPESSSVPAPGRMAATEQVEGSDWIALVGVDQAVTQLVEGRDPAWLSADALVYSCPQSSPDFLGICTLDVGSPASPSPLVAEADRPAPAPDGSSIAFHRGTIDVGATWIVAPDGSGLRELSPGDFRRWSPDGARLAGQPESATLEVAVIGADGSGLEILAPGYDPAWSPDGTRIAHVLVDGQGASLRTVDVASGEVEVRYTAPADAVLAAPAWLADGGLVFVEDGDLWRLDAGSDTPARLSTGLAIPTDAPGEPLEVSSDGTWIAYGGGSGAGAVVGIASVLDDTQIAITGSGPLSQPRWAPAVTPSPSESAAPSGSAPAP